MTNLSEKAMLVKCSTPIPGNIREDRVLTKEIKTYKDMGEDSGEWKLKLYPKEAYAPLVTLVGKIKTWHYANSLCWKDDGQRILTSAAYMDYTAKMREFKQEFDFVKMMFLSQYDSYVQWARIAHNGSFNIKNYPGMEAIEKKFNFIVDFSPLPNENDFRVALQEEEVQAIQRNIESSKSLAIAEAMRDLRERLRIPIANMATILGDTKDRKIFDSLVTNIQDIVEAIPKLNLIDDQALDNLAKEAQALTKYSTEEIRENPDVKKDLAKKAQDIVDKMTGYFA